MSNKEPEIDPIEIELDLINELVADNIIIIIHENGMSIMMNEDLEDRPDEQLAMFSRLYVASKPSLVLRLFLNIEIYFLILAEMVEYHFKRWFKKDE